MSGNSPISESAPARFDHLIAVAGLPEFGLTVLCGDGLFLGLEMYDAPETHLTRCMVDRVCVYAATLCVKAQLSGKSLSSVLAELPICAAFDGERAVVGKIISSVFANSLGLTGQDESGAVRV